MSVPQTHAKIVGDALTRPIDTTARVLMASRGRAARPTLMNACQRLVFTGGSHFSLSVKEEAHSAHYAKMASELFLITPCQLSEWRLTSHVVRS